MVVVGDWVGALVSRGGSTQLQTMKMNINVSNAMMKQLNIGKS